VPPNSALNDRIWHPKLGDRSFEAGPFGTETFMGKKLAFRSYTNFVPTQVFRKLAFPMQAFKEEKQLS